MKLPLICLVLGLMAGAAVSLYLMKERAHWLSSLSFTLSEPEVPVSVLTSVRNAEAASYAKRSLMRRAIEDVQDVIVFASPELAYRLNFSVGRYRIKARTVRDRLSWAQEAGYLTLTDGTSLRAFSHALAYFAEQPGLNDWQAAVYLEWLRRDHPELTQMSWDTIASDPKLVAKLYSGYMGAGGAWDSWRANLTPGPEARKRMGLD